MKKLTIYLVLVFCQLTLLAQNNYSFEAVIDNLPSTKIYLYNYEGDRNQLLDSATTNQTGKFEFLFRPNMQVGIYKIEVGIDIKQQRPYTFNFVFNNENIRLSTSMPALTDSMTVMESEENKMYFNFNRYNEKILRQLSTLYELKNTFPDDDSFYPAVKARYEQIQLQYQYYFDSIFQVGANSFTINVINAGRFPVVDFTVAKADVRTFLLSHYFDYLVFNNEKLIGTDLYTSKAFSYIQMYVYQNLDKNAQEAEFMKAIDIVLQKAAVNKKVQLQIIDYLVRGFEQIGMEALLIHIAEYIEESGCADGTAETNMKNKLEGFTKMAIGKYVPDFSINCSPDGTFNLYKSSSPYSLIIFWASWCPHCIETLPEIKKVYGDLKANSLDIVAISIDTSETEWRKAIREGGFTWKNCCDLEGWNGSTAKNFYLSATPSIFLVDRQKKIIAKPMNADELFQKLQELGVN